MLFVDVSYSKPFCKPCAYHTLFPDKSGTLTLLHAVYHIMANYDIILLRNKMCYVKVFEKKIVKKFENLV